MALRAKYDPKQDRMLLTLHPAEGEPHAFWVTRRQWLGLLHAMTDLPALAAEPDAPPRPPSRQRRLSANVNETPPEPIPVRGIRLRRLTDGVKLIFVTGVQGVGVDFSTAGVAQLRAMLQQQAERAGWDVGAALARLNAATVANAAMKKARQLH